LPCALLVPSPPLLSSSASDVSSSMSLMSSCEDLMKF
jgi:hypothetical protein